MSLKTLLTELVDGKQIAAEVAEKIEAAANTAESSVEKIVAVLDRVEAACDKIEAAAEATTTDGTTDTDTTASA